MLGFGRWVLPRSSHTEPAQLQRGLPVAACTAGSFQGSFWGFAGKQLCLGGRPGHGGQLVNQVTVLSIIHQVVLQTDHILILLYLNYKKAKQTNKQNTQFLNFH